MKTREQAEAIALEFYPDVNDFGDHSFEFAVFKKEHRLLREGFLQCWEEMQQNKQTCGFCVEPATELPNEKHSESLDTKEDEGSELHSEKQKELLCEMMRKDEEDDYRNGVRDVVKYLLNAQPTDDEEVIDNYTDSIVSNNKLREAAEKVVDYALYGGLEVSLHDAIVELEKALK